MEQRKLILITNDDGYQAQGIGHLTTLMRQLGDVVVVAPDGPRSGAACSISPTTPVHLREVSREDGLLVVACSGTPVDCVKLAGEQVCPRRPDLVVSGINHGDNASVSVHYSGTMGAVYEACMKGIPAIGYSLRTLSHQCDFNPYSDSILSVARHVLESGLPQGICLNVNYPVVDRLAGTRVCRLGKGMWSGEWANANHPRGSQAFWLTGVFTDLEPESEDTDYWALDHGYASVTPLQMDNTAYSFMSDLVVLAADKN